MLVFGHSCIKPVHVRRRKILDTRKELASYYILSLYILLFYVCVRVYCFMLFVCFSCIFVYSCIFVHIVCCCVRLSVITVFYLYRGLSHPLHYGDAEHIWMEAKTSTFQSSVCLTVKIETLSAFSIKTRIRNYFQDLNLT